MLEVPNNTQTFFAWINFRYYLNHFGEKVFGPEFFYRMLYLFKVSKLDAFLAHERQSRRIGLIYFVTSSQGFIHAGSKHKQREIAFFFDKMRDSCSVFGREQQKWLWKWQSFVQNIFFFNDNRLGWVRRRKKKDRFCNLSLFMLVSWVNATLRWRHKVSWTHSPVLSSMSQKNDHLPCFQSVQHLKEKSRAKNFFAKAIRAKVYLCEKN